MVHPLLNYRLYVHMHALCIHMLYLLCLSTPRLSNGVATMCTHSVLYVDTQYYVCNPVDTQCTYHALCIYIRTLC